MKIQPDRIRGSVPRTKEIFKVLLIEYLFLNPFFCFILLVSEVPLMSLIQKTSPDPDPVKFGPDPGL